MDQFFFVPCKNDKKIETEYKTTSCDCNSDTYELTYLQQYNYCLSWIEKIIKKGILRTLSNINCPIKLKKKCSASGQKRRSFRSSVRGGETFLFCELESVLTLQTKLRLWEGIQKHSRRRDSEIPLKLYETHILWRTIRHP